MVRKLVVFLVLFAMVGMIATDNKTTVAPKSDGNDPTPATKDTVSPAVTETTTTPEQDETTTDNSTETTTTEITTVTEPITINTTDTTTEEQTTVTEPAPPETTTDKTNTTTTVAPSSTTTAPPPDDDHPRHFDGWSFFGGILFTLALLAVLYVGYKYYSIRKGRSGSGNYSMF